MRRLKNKAQPFDAAWLDLPLRPSDPSGYRRVAFRIGGYTVEEDVARTTDKARAKVMQRLRENLKIVEDGMHAMPTGCKNLLAAARAISEALGWSMEHGLAMAYRFAIPSRLPFLHIGFTSEERPGAGRPIDATASNAIFLRMATAWNDLTRCTPRLSVDSPFLKAVEAAAPYFGLYFAELRGALLRRARNLNRRRILLGHRPAQYCGGLLLARSAGIFNASVLTAVDHLRGG